MFPNKCIYLVKPSNGFTIIIAVFNIYIGFIFSYLFYHGKIHTHIHTQILIKYIYGKNLISIHSWREDNRD